MTVGRLLPGCSNKSEECFDKLSTNGKSQLFLKVSADSNKVFWHPAGS
jgi:hypothetical protein